MTKTIKLLAILAVIILGSSFKNRDSAVYIGTYGVSASDPACIKLSINADHSFYYQDFSVQHNKIVVNGNWSVSGKKIILTANGAVKKFHNVWTFAENGDVAKSRKGLAFYRLSKLGQ